MQLFLQVAPESDLLEWKNTSSNKEDSSEINHNVISEVEESYL